MNNLCSKVHALPSCFVMRCLAAPGHCRGGSMTYLVCAERAGGKMVLVTQKVFQALSSTAVRWSS